MDFQTDFCPCCSVKRGGCYILAGASSTYGLGVGFTCVSCDPPISSPRVQVAEVSCLLFTPIGQCFSSHFDEDSY
uniref:Unnamed protein product n=1 Tax=Macaca fascicularis TaxID=9541 RepID=Q9N087_MACFA|nr:unnamed protein product [Macaca fascicularis]